MFKVAGYEPPHFGVKITDQNGELFYYADLGVQVPEREDVPEWKELGAILHTEGQTLLKIEFLSEGKQAWGNDFCVDDVSLREVLIPEPDPPQVKIAKKADKTCLTGMKNAVFTITVENASDTQIKNISFKDVLPLSLGFEKGSVTVDGVSYPNYDPNIGFSFNLPAGQTAVIEFKASAISYPHGGTVCNKAVVTYPYSVIEGGVPVEFVVKSKPVCLKIAQIYKGDDGEFWILPPTKEK
jgi:uncharacterized repeat protein (TIGR01451 family)